MVRPTPRTGDQMTRALYVARWGGADTLEIRRRPMQALFPRSIRVQVHASGINYVDVYKRRGIYLQKPPFALGEEGSGIVIDVDAETTDFAVGDRVSWVNVSGSIADEVVLHQGAAIRVPDAIDLDAACACMVQGLTAHFLANSLWAIHPGDHVLVHAAAGGVGQLLVQMLAKAGATVVATAGSAEKLALATALGATHAINYRDFSDDPEGLARHIVDIAGRKVDVAFDGVGIATFECSLRALRPRGLLALFGAASGPVPPVDPQLLNTYGSLYLTRPSLSHFLERPGERIQRAREVFDAVHKGDLSVRVSHVYQLEEAERAYKDLESRVTTGKLLFRHRGLD